MRGIAAIILVQLPPHCRRPATRPPSHAQGRVVLWAWMQERERLPGTYDHACCISAPRCLWLAPALGPSSPSGGGDTSEGAAAVQASRGLPGGEGSAPPRFRLWQEPLPELSELRRSSAKGRWAWKAGAAAAAPADAGAAAAHAAREATLPLASGLRTGHLDLEVEVEQSAGAAGSGSGGGFAILLQRLAPGGEGAAVVFSWATQTLQVWAAACVQFSHVSYNLLEALPTTHTAAARMPATQHTYHFARLQATHSPWQHCPTPTFCPHPPSPLPAPQIVHSIDPAAIAAAAAAPFPPPHRLCGFPDSPLDAAAPAADEPAASAAGRDVNASAEGSLEYPLPSDYPLPAAAAPAAAGLPGRAAAPGSAESPPLPRRAGGLLRWLPGGAGRLGLRLLLDHSLVEVFTSTGEVLSGRAYRGDGPPLDRDRPADDPSSAAPAYGAVELRTWGGCQPAAAAAYEMGSIWRPREAEDVAAVGEAAVAAAVSAASEGPGKGAAAAGGWSAEVFGTAAAGGREAAEVEERRLQDREVLMAASGLAGRVTCGGASGALPQTPETLCSPARAARQLPWPRGAVGPRPLRVAPAPRGPSTRHVGHAGRPGLRTGLALRAAAEAALAGACRWDACCVEGALCGCGGRVSPVPPLLSPRAGGGERAGCWDDWA
jgi:hypothetical protein